MDNRFNLWIIWCYLVRSLCYCVLCIGCDVISPLEQVFLLHTLFPFWVLQL